MGAGTEKVGQRVAIVDDDHSARRAFVRFFLRRGWTVTAAATRNECLSHAEKVPPSHAILEQDLPDGSGLRLLGELKRLHPDIVVVIVTRHASLPGAVKAIRCGASNYLSKPVRASQVARALTAPAEEPSAGDTPFDAIGSDVISQPASSLARLEWEHLRGVLQDCDGNVTEAARALGLHRRSLQRKLSRARPRR